MQENPPVYQKLPTKKEIYEVASKTNDSIRQFHLEMILKELTVALPKNHEYTIVVFSGTLDNQVLHAQDRSIFIGEHLLDMTQNDDEVAFLVAHEIAHWENDDLSKNRALIVSGEKIKHHECSADKKAMGIIETSGFSREKCTLFLQRMNELYGRKSCILEN